MPEVEGEAILDLSDLRPEDRKKICEKLEGYIDSAGAKCVVRLIVDTTNPKTIKILGYKREEIGDGL